MIDNPNLVVVKRDLEREPFSYDKLISSILKSGVPMPEAEKLSQSIKNWVMENAKANEIDSLALRDKITEVLSKDFPSEADSYQAFIKG